MASGRSITTLGFVAVVAALAVLASATIVRAADDNVEFAIPRMADALNCPNAALVGYNCTCPRCYNCPGGPSSTGPGSSQPGGENAPSDGAQAPQGADLDPQAFGGLSSNTWAINDAPGGYIDNPIVGTWFRMRYDNAGDNVAPDRAEFFYAKCGGLGGPGPQGPAGVAANHVNYQDISPYFEVLLYPRLSVFAEIPVRIVELGFPALSPGSGGTPSAFSSNGGLADMNAGFKYALYTDASRYLTFQFKTYIPTGDASLGLGTNHVSLEPGLLYLRRLTSRSYFQGELRDWIPVGGTDFAGNVLRYGGGIGYDVYRTYDAPLNPYVSNGGLRITAVTEFVGWSVLNGKEVVSTPNIAGGVDQTVQSAKGDTIVNLKLGARASMGKSSLYVGWGHALTSDTWYSDLLRVEFRRMF